MFDLMEIIFPCDVHTDYCDDYIYFCKRDSDLA